MKKEVDYCDYCKEEVADYRVTDGKDKGIVLCEDCVDDWKETQFDERCEDIENVCVQPSPNSSTEILKTETLTMTRNVALKHIEKEKLVKNIYHMLKVQFKEDAYSIDLDEGKGENTWDNSSQFLRKLAIFDLEYLQKKIKAVVK